MTASLQRAPRPVIDVSHDSARLAEWKTLLGLLINSGGRLRFFPHRTMMFLALIELSEDATERAELVRSAAETLAEFDRIVAGFTTDPSVFVVSTEVWPWLAQLMQRDRTSFDEVASHFSSHAHKIIATIESEEPVRRRRATLDLSKMVATRLLDRMNKVNADLATELADVAVRDAQSSHNQDASSAYIVEVTDELSRVNATVHMISINAMIQAARAGDSGKAFAIIAAEIQKLSGEIRTLTTGIRTRLASSR